MRRHFATAVLILVIERATGKVILVVEDPTTGTARASISLADKSLTIRGQGCDRTEPL